METIMTDLFSINILLYREIVELLLLSVSIMVIIIMILLNNRQSEKSSKKVKTDIAELKKHLEVQNSYLSQFSDHFKLIDDKLKTLESTTSVTSRDISSMAEGISGEVGVGKAIELARQGGTVEEILQNSNLKKDQAELIVKFHGGKNSIPK